MATSFLGKLGGVERSGAEAIYDGAREACVQFILELAARLNSIRIG